VILLWHFPEFGTIFVHNKQKVVFLILELFLAGE